jgi:hypothetical protein
MVPSAPMHLDHKFIFELIFRTPVVSRTYQNGKFSHPTENSARLRDHESYVVARFALRNIAVSFGYSVDAQVWLLSLALSSSAERKPAVADCPACEPAGRSFMMIMLADDDASPVVQDDDAGRYDAGRSFMMIMPADDDASPVIHDHDAVDDDAGVTLSAL